MRVHLIAVGRLKAGPEKQLFDDYADRFRKTGRAYGLTDLNLHEIDERKASSKADQGQQILAALPAGAVVWACDERGQQVKSEHFAHTLQTLADQGTADLAILIGGADGLSEAVLDTAHTKIAFGKMVWPHMLVRVMLAEQLYRATSILAGLPYHRA